VSRQLPLPFPHTTDFDDAPFLRAPSNETALAWLDHGTWPHGRLLLWGEPGCGKTHLLHHWSRQTNARILAGPQLLLEPPLQPIAVDDADLAPELALLHLLNAASEAGLPVLLTAALPPSRWRFAIPDLASRLRATTAVEIGPAEDSLLRMLLARLLADRQLAVAEPVHEYLLRRLPRTPAAIREAASRLDRLALASGHRITRGLAAHVIAEIVGEDGPADDEDSDERAVSGSPQACALV
jgi:chromosomal replication initiation ATPase DnaA